MDDGDILNLTIKPKKKNDNVTDEPDLKMKPEPKFMEHCGGLGLGLDLRFLSEYDKNRYFLWRRIDVPREVIRSKLSDFVDFEPGTQEESIQVLQELAKGFIAKEIEQTRTRQSQKQFPTSDPISVRELLENQEPVFKRSRWF